MEKQDGHIGFPIIRTKIGISTICPDHSCKGSIKFTLAVVEKKTAKDPLNLNFQRHLVAKCKGPLAPNEPSHHHELPDLK